MDGNYYHIVNFGIENRLVFTDEKDINRFIAILDYYRFKNPPSRFSFRKRSQYANHATNQTPIIEMLSFCLMPNRFHLLLKQIEDGGVSHFLSQVANSYTKYFNHRNKRSGPLFQGTFKSVPVDKTEITHVSRHIHLSPFTSGIVRDLKRFPFSSYPEYLSLAEGFCQKHHILSEFADISEYENFVLNVAANNQSIKANPKLYLTKFT